MSIISFSYSQVVVGPLDVHPSQSAIVVHYDIEALVVNEFGEEAVADRKSAQKVYVCLLYAAHQSFYYVSAIFLQH